MRSIAVVVLMLQLVSCGAEPVPDPVPDESVLTVETSGGCAQIGPNCFTISIMGDGTVEAYRIGPDQPALVDTGSIGREMVVALHRLASSTDLNALYQRLPEGECRGCYDGIDTAMWFSAYPTAEMPMVFSSVDVELDASEPLFEAAWAVYEEALAVVEIPTVSR